MKFKVGDVVKNLQDGEVGVVYRCYDMTWVRQYLVSYPNNRLGLAADSTIELVTEIEKLLYL